MIKADTVSDLILIIGRCDLLGPVTLESTFNTCSTSLQLLEDRKYDANHSNARGENGAVLANSMRDTKVHSLVFSKP